MFPVVGFVTRGYIRQPYACIRIIQKIRRVVFDRIGDNPKKFQKHDLEIAIGPKCPASWPEKHF